MSPRGKSTDQTKPVDPREKVVHQWTFRLPPLGEAEGGWLYMSDNPACPIADFTVKQSLVPKMPAEVVITMTIIPADPPKTGKMEIAPLGETRMHEVHERDVPESHVVRGPQADAYEPGYPKP